MKSILLTKYPHCAPNKVSEKRMQISKNVTRTAFMKSQCMSQRKFVNVSFFSHY